MARESSQINRRSFLKYLLGTVILFIAILVFGRFLIWPRRREIYSHYFGRPSVGDEFGELSPEQMRYIMAMAEVIYPASIPSELNQLYNVVEQWTKARVKKDGYFNVYKNGIEKIKSYTAELGHETPFYKLPISERKKILHKYRSVTANDLYLRPGLDEPVQLLAFLVEVFFNRNNYRHIFFASKLIDDVIQAVFSSHLGWSLLEYNTWPGVPGNPLEFTQPPKPY